MMIATLAGLVLVLGAPRVQSAPADQIEVLEDLEEDFAPIRNVSGLPEPLVAAWREEGKAKGFSFPAALPYLFDPQPSGPLPLSMADPGQPFQFGCIAELGMPVSRMILAGCNSRRCFVEYETGGYMHSFHLAGFSAGQDPHLLWAGSISRSGESLESLRVIVGQRWYPSAAK